jgi:hypothetical protein
MLVVPPLARSSSMKPAILWAQAIVVTMGFTPDAEGNTLWE